MRIFPVRRIDYILVGCWENEGIIEEAGNYGRLDGTCERVCCCSGPREFSLKEMPVGVGRVSASSLVCYVVYRRS